MPMNLSIFKTYRILLSRESDGGLFPGFVLKSEDGNLFVRTHDAHTLMVGDLLQGSIVIHHKKATFTGTVASVCENELGLKVSGQIDIIDTPESARRTSGSFQIAKVDNSQFRVEIMDIALEGVGLKTTYKFDPGTELTLEIVHGDASFEMPFEVRYCHEIDDSGFYKVGCRADTRDQVLSLKYLLYVQADDPIQELFDKKAA